MIPDTLYHATANLPAVEADGVLRARGAGGLGGDKSDRIVSLTTDLPIAERIAEDMRFTRRIRHRAWPGTALRHRRARRLGRAAWRPMQAIRS